MRSRRGKPRLYSATAVAERKLQAGCRVGGSLLEAFSGNSERAAFGLKQCDQLGKRRVALQLLGYFILQVVGQPFFKLIL